MSNGKGSKQRPTNMKKYGKNYDKAFKKELKKTAQEANVNIDPDTGAISVTNKDGTIKTKERKIIVKREYVDQNGIEMCIVNIDDAMTNKTMTKKMLRALEHSIVNEEHPEAIKASLQEKEIEAKLEKQLKERKSNKTKPK
jgi:prenyltransferase beta subunit